MDQLSVLSLGIMDGGRCARTLEHALSSRPHCIRTSLDASLLQSKILFAVSLEESGVNLELSTLLAFLRTHPGCLSGSVGGILLDGAGELYTKAAARELALAANLAGCSFPGHPLVEGTGTLDNFSVQAKNANCSTEEAYRLAAADLVGRILEFSPPLRLRPKLVVLHASNRRTSNTLALWSRLRQMLDDACDITEIGLRNGTLEDCCGCPYTMCLHYGEAGSCFYGGVMVQEVYPAIRDADAVILLCPNYNDALSANLTACINRLTALYRTASFREKAVFAVVVSGYSGGDLVAGQILGALCMNKGFWLPSQFCMLETANDAGTVLKKAGIVSRAADFAQRLRQQLSGDSA